MVTSLLVAELKVVIFKINGDDDLFIYRNTDSKEILHK